LLPPHYENGVESIKRITAGASVDAALQAFREHVNQPGTASSRDPWLLTKFGRLRQLLSDPITAEQAEALLDVLSQRRWMTDLIEWLESPEVSWFNFPAFRSALAYEFSIRQEWKDCLDVGEDEVGVWEECIKVFLPRARPCPRCRTPPEFLNWYLLPGILVLDVPGWFELRTRCKFCRAEIDFFTTIPWSVVMLRRPRKAITIN